MLIDAIQTQAKLAEPVLELVKRPAGDAQSLGSLEEAIECAGAETVRNLFLAVWVFQAFQAGQAERGPFSRMEFWKHSIAVACAAELLAEQMVGTWGNDCDLKPSEAFLCGLVHDLGKLALDVTLPKSFARVVEAADLLRGNIADVERAVIGIDHLVVGKRLAEQWEVSSTLRDCIWLHGQLPQALPATVRRPRMVNLITLADLIAREQHLGYSGNYLFNQTRQALADVIGLTSEQVAEASARLVERIEPRARRWGWARRGSPSCIRKRWSGPTRSWGTSAASWNRRTSGWRSARNSSMT